MVKIVEGPKRGQRHAAGKIPLLDPTVPPRKLETLRMPFASDGSEHLVEPVARAELAITNYFDQQNPGWQVEIDRAWSL
jgi:hypothetical protein